ncbi:roadblock/LC7 domain-containing protein [Gloeothece verrucosa]|uniref:Roadblock/LC7 family protein n=1 Tax=Gloeothece verrucosa (strain PCC 7822) TaxID=497965 RepID=E0UAK2_GLOV7|nr:dynein regulation protein LC7 [Gloeothece verrucosa]ADN12743.1 Roadblock/LC7 family protein [Gloeothece verrucosa PCC 7822]
MPLLVEQLIYTSFSKIGFKCFTSELIPLVIKRAFTEQIVNQHWNTYEPPEAGFRAAYLHQISPSQTLFGWLYNDGPDDFGRSNIPYFICYYIAENLTPFQLDKIITCLETGPVDIIDRKDPPEHLDNLLIPDFCLYEAPIRGVAIGSEIRQQSHNNLKQNKLINLFVSGEKSTLIQAKETVIQSHSTKSQLGSNSTHTTLDLPSVSAPGINSQISSSTNKLEEILQELATKPIGIEGVVLVSVEGYPIIPSINIDDNTALIIAGTMLYLAKSAEEEFGWQQIENISIKGPQGHIILAICNLEMFLLVKAGKAVTGLLEAEIKRTIKKLNAAMEVPQAQKALTPKPPQTSPDLKEKNNSVPAEDETFLPEMTEDVSLKVDQDIRYRGRRTNL